ncbi:hypothetical protein VSU19_20910 [Verrucomicrobiales bacterium BCK34]|nr:hypothetical protein [Verrucomicrobiales bacterium BCK34]
METEQFEHFAKRYREAIASRLWDQWAAIGAGGYSSKGQPVTWCVDPEALILASSRLFQYEPRLRDSSLEWILTFSDFLSIARIKRMQADYGFGDAEAMAGLASSVLATNPSLRSWQSIEKWKDSSVVAEVLPFHRRGIAPISNFRGTEQLVLKFRALFGVTSRVEILIWMYQRGDCGLSEIASETAWFRKTVQKAVTDMALSGVVQEADSSERGKAYFMPTSPWVELFPQGFSIRQRVSQHFLYSGVFRLMSTLDRGAFQSLSGEVGKLLLSEALSESYGNHQRARRSELRGANPEESLVTALDLLVSDAECGEAWPARSFEVNPSQVKFVMN